MHHILEELALMAATEWARAQAQLQTEPVAFGEGVRRVYDAALSGEAVASAPIEVALADAIDRRAGPLWLALERQSSLSAPEHPSLQRSRQP